VVAQAAQGDDREAVRTAMSVAGIRFRDHPGMLVISVFMPGLRHMAAHGDTSWLGLGLSTWYNAELVEALDEAQARETLTAMRNTRVELMTRKPLAAYAAAVVAGQPNWAEYYRLLEDIAGDVGTTLDKLSEAGLAKRPALKAFASAANNRAFGRHGTSKRSKDVDQSALMNLLEAREFVRGVVTRWLDAQCGDILPTDRVDGGPLRFGLDADE
jgi:hypothetical protein